MTAWNVCSALLVLATATESRDSNCGWTGSGLDQAWGAPELAEFLTQHGYQGLIPTLKHHELLSPDMLGSLSRQDLWNLFPKHKYAQLMKLEKLLNPVQENMIPQLSTGWLVLLLAGGLAFASKELRSKLHVGIQVIAFNGFFMGRKAGVMAGLIQPKPKANEKPKTRNSPVLDQSSL
eukprot:TRINITY_DN21168_c0_g1_i1.p3 TRINITY_DN21168_c0_g1~~TRINITY_DN21168_c0_g1_i1.p3  ORF type:complete len:178 (-),score=23.90 TRINITY_DN21168_c0_g1_i1:418-951(-)